MKRTLTLAQQIKKDLKAKFPELKVSCTGTTPKICLKNLHETKYTFSEVDKFCKQYESIHRDEITGEISSGGNTFVFVVNDIKDSTYAELKQIFIAYLEELQPPYKFDYNDFDNHINSLYGCHRELWYNLKGNQAFETVKLNPIDESPAEAEVKTESQKVIPLFKDNQAQIEKEIIFVEFELTKIVDLIEYLTINDIEGDIYNATIKRYNELNKTLEELKSKLDPTIEIRNKIELNNKKLIQLSEKLTQAIAELELTEIAKIQNAITNIVNSIEILQNKLDTIESKAILLK